MQYDSAGGDVDAKKISVSRTHIMYRAAGLEVGRPPRPRSRSPLRDGFQRSCYNIIIYYGTHAFTDFPLKISEINLTRVVPPPPPKDRSQQ